VFGAHIVLATQGDFSGVALTAAGIQVYFTGDGRPIIDALATELPGLVYEAVPARYSLVELEHAFGKITRAGFDAAISIPDNTILVRATDFDADALGVAAGIVTFGDSAVAAIPGQVSSWPRDWMAKYQQ
jgi:hypothetical protein